MPYIPANLLEKSKKFLSSSALNNLYPGCTGAYGFAPTPSKSPDSQISLDYISLTSSFISSGIDDSGLEISHYSLKQMNVSGVSYRQKCINFLASFVHNFFLKSPLKITHLLSDNQLLHDCRYWKVSKGISFYSKSLTHTSGVRINFSELGELNHDSINIVFPGEALRALTFQTQLQILYKLLWFGFKPSRLDFAYDSFSHQSVGDYYKICENGNFFGVRSDSVHYHKKLNSRGETLYLGSRQSEKMMRIYDAGVKHCRKLIDSLPFNWTRFEAEIKGKKVKEIAKLLKYSYEELLKEGQLFNDCYILKPFTSLAIVPEGLGEIKIFDENDFLEVPKFWEQYYQIWRGILLGVVDFRDKISPHKDRCPRLSV